MSAFLLMTIFPQLPCVLFLGFYQELLFPFDESCGAIMVILLVVELLIGYLTLHSLIARQTAQFYRLVQKRPGRADSGREDTGGGARVHAPHVID